ncbi:MAG: hypothetical protein AMXMBFR84_06010 [Candidatus Hydrogenedentota bacterium]
MNFIKLAATAVLTAAIATGSALAQPGGPTVAVSILPEHESVAPNSEQRLAVQVKLDDGWHVNAHKPLEDFLIPTNLALEAPEGVEVLSIAYPEAKLQKFGFSNEPMAVYESSFTIGVKVRVNNDASAGDIAIPATLSYQACNDSSCWAPQKQTLSLSLKVADSTSPPIHADVFTAIAWDLPADAGSSGQDDPPITAKQSGRGGPEMAFEIYRETTDVPVGGELRLALLMRVPENFHVNSNKPLDELLIPTELTFETPEHVTVAETAYPEAQTIPFGESDSMSVYEGDVWIGARFEIGPEAATGDKTIKATLRYQACDDKQCFAPASVTMDIPVSLIDGKAPAPQHSAVFDRIAFTGKAQTMPTATNPQSPGTTTVESDAWKDLLPQFNVAGQAGGLLNKDQFLAWLDNVETGATESEPAGIVSTIGKVFSGGFSFKGMGLPLVILLTLVGGVALNLTPCVLPVIPINLAIIGAGAQAGCRSRGFALGGVYGLGIALIYGVLGLVAVFGLGSFGSINASPWFNIGIALLFVVLALAMFDILLIDFSKYQTKLGIKKDKGSFLFAFIMGSISALLAGACVAPVVIAVVLYAQDLYAGGNAVGLALPFLLGVGMALPWPIAGAGLSFLPKPGMWMVRVKQAFGIFILAFAAYYGYQGYQLLDQRYFVDRDAVVASTQEGGWEHSLYAGLARAKAENKPVFIDFWATWCKNCLVMNTTTFRDPEVLARLDNYVKIKYQAELPEDSPYKDVLANFDEYVGLPLYAVLEAK